MKNSNFYFHICMPSTHTHTHTHACTFRVTLAKCTFEWSCTIIIIIAGVVNLANFHTCEAAVLMGKLRFRFFPIWLILGTVIVWIISSWLEGWSFMIWFFVLLSHTHTHTLNLHPNKPTNRLWCSLGRVFWVVEKVTCLGISRWRVVAVWLNEHNFDFMSVKV